MKNLQVIIQTYASLILLVTALALGTLGTLRECLITPEAIKASHYGPHLNQKAAEQVMASFKGVR